jgi:hypothetical protein
MTADDEQGSQSTQPAPQPTPTPPPIKPATPTYGERGDNRPLEHK